MRVSKGWTLALASGVVLVSAGAGLGCSSAAARTPAASLEARVTRKTVEDVFLLAGELRAVRSESIVSPRAEGEMQIRWMAEDGADVKEGERLVELDSTRLIQTIEERRLRVQQAAIDRESKERNALAEAERKKAATDKAEVEAEKAEIDAVVPRELRPAADWRKFQTTWQEKKAALEKARLEQTAWVVAARADVAAARATEEKARRELEAAEKALASMSLTAPTAGVFLVGNFWQWGPEGPRKLQPGDTVWPGFTIGTIPDPSEMEVQAALAETDRGRIAPGMKVRCILDTYPTRVFEGEIREVGSVAMEGGRGWGASASKAGFPVRVKLTRSDPLMRPGLSVRVEVVRAVWEDALVVPRGAVRFEAERAAVRREGGTAVPVTLSGCTPVECVVESGLTEGERVEAF
jgi:HlyD family secretion protein